MATDPRPRTVTVVSLEKQIQGSGVGIIVGDRIGLLLGFDDLEGAKEGLRDGLRLGTNETLGLLLGTLDGFEDGTKLLLGMALGLLEGLEVGAEVQVRGAQ